MTSGKALLSFALFFSFVHGFSFSHNPPTQCDPFVVSWSGGTAPFSLLLTPIFDNPRNFSIPDSAVNAGSGSFTVQLPISAGQQFIVAMSDVTGFGTGGVSDILTVGNSVSGASCSTQIPTPGFEFELDSQLQQCQPYTISGYDGATQPVTITGLIPLGKPFQLHPAPGPSSFTWDRVNVPAGTDIVFFLTDAAGKFGGSSHVNQVGSSSDNSCIDGQSPSSTAQSAPSSPTATSGTPSSVSGAPTATVTVSPGSTRISASTIGGAVAGGLVALLVVGTLAAFFFNKHRSRKRYSSARFSRGFGTNHDQHGGFPSADLLQPNSANPLQPVPPHSFQQVPPHSFQQMSPHPYAAQHSPWSTFSSSSGAEYVTEPYTFQPPSANRTYSSTADATENVRIDSRSDFTSPLPTEQPAQSTKSSMGPPPQRMQRLVLHTDAEDIELPPQYADRSGSYSHLPPS